MWPKITGGVAFPVHPGTPAELLPGYARPFAGPFADPFAGLRGRATLSMRTLAMVGHPGTYLKLPMPVRTLGRLNLRRLSELDTSARLLRAAEQDAGQNGERGKVRFLGLQLHLASGLDAPAHLELCRAGLHWARQWAERAGLPLRLVNLGGGMSVDYACPANLFDWKREGEGLARLAAEYPGVRLRLEPGRSVAAYSGWYATRVVDVRRSHGEWFAVVDGGTHHLRTPAARGHDQPFDVVPADGPEAWPYPWPRPQSGAGPLTVAGALCTPRDVLSRRAGGSRIRAGDVVLFGLAGAYGWNISHHEFLMHPEPSFHYLDGAPGRPAD